MTTTSPAPAAPPYERSSRPTAVLAREDLTRLQDLAAARSWAAVDRRRDPRRQHR